MRRPSLYEAVEELRWLVGCHRGYALKDVHVILGDVNTCELPTVKHIVNASGFTSLTGPPEMYWRANIMPAVRLAHHANATGAKLHQLSSVAVAEFRPRVLLEGGRAVPDPRQLTYSTSKVLMELAVSSVKPNTQVLRLGDVVPPPDRLQDDWRRTHWLSILFASGPEGFSFAPKDYSVWLADAAQLAEAVALLLNKPAHCYHVLGRRYAFGYFQSHAAQASNPRLKLARRMTEIVMHGPEAKQVADDFTIRALDEEDFTWKQLSPEYWRAFGVRSTQKDVA